MVSSGSSMRSGYPSGYPGRITGRPPGRRCYDVAVSPVHPDLRRIAPFLPRQAITERTLGPTRFLQRTATRAGNLLSRRPSRGSVPEVVPVGAAPVSMRLHRPPAMSPEGPLPALLWIHGGGYVLGDAAQEDAFCRRFARLTGLLVAAVEYRLAPEHPYPVPLHDCHDALVALADRPDVDAERIVIGGGSAGGGLAAALAALARDRGEVTPVLQLLSYPMLDDRTVLRGDVDERHFRLWTNRSNRFGWRSYLGRDPGGDGVDPLAAPARLDDLAGLPPAWIGIGTLDLFLDEDLAYAERLREAGVHCDLSVVDGAFHGFDALLPAAGVSRRYVDDMAAAVRSAIRPLV